MLFILLFRFRSQNRFVVSGAQPMAPLSDICRLHPILLQLKASHGEHPRFEATMGSYCLQFCSCSAFRLYDVWGKECVTLIRQCTYWSAWCRLWRYFRNFNVRSIRKKQICSPLSYRFCRNLAQNMKYIWIHFEWTVSLILNWNDPLVKGNRSKWSLQVESAVKPSIMHWYAILHSALWEKGS